MRATVDGITYEGTEEEIRHIVENPPHRPPIQINWWDGNYNQPMPQIDFPTPPTRDYPIVMCSFM